MAAKKKGNNPFDFLENLSDLGDVQKFLGADFFKNLPLPNMKNGAFFSDSSREDDDFPAVDVYSRGHEIVVIMELPGLASSSDVSLTVRSNVLHVKGEISTRFRLRDDTIVLSECHQGPFEREIELPDRVLPDKVRAVYRSGLLIVYLSKDRPSGTSDSFIPIDFRQE